MMRLDKFLTNYSPLSRSESVKAVKAGRVFVDGQKLNSDDKIEEGVQIVTLDGQVVEYKKYVYIMLNKPFGVVSATEDREHKTVLDLVSKKYEKYNLFPCGRLDKDTLGLVILTNDGESAHNALSPKKHVEKTYLFKCAEILSDGDKKIIESGVTLKDGYTTKPCILEINEDLISGKITLTEGKYHEIKRIFGALGNKITYLERIRFGKIFLDKNLKRGETRELTPDEIKVFRGE